MDRIIRTPDQIRRKIEGWLIRHEQKEEEQFDGKEVFTLYSKLSTEILFKLESVLELNTSEIPILVLSVENDGFIVNTTDRFIRVFGSNTESILYSDFDYHVGFTSISAKDSLNTKSESIKVEGLFQDFGIKTKSGKILYWILPTGKPGFAFWNVTDKCEVIGRRFLINSLPSTGLPPGEFPS